MADGRQEISENSILATPTPKNHRPFVAQWPLANFVKNAYDCSALAPR